MDYDFTLNPSEDDLNRMSRSKLEHQFSYLVKNDKIVSSSHFIDFHTKKGTIEKTSNSLRWPDFRELSDELLKELILYLANAENDESEESQIYSLLQQQSWPVPVADWKIRIGEDSLDNPAIWAWVILESSQEHEQRDMIRKKVLERIARSGEKRWVYVLFRTKAEQDELECEEKVLE